MLASPATPILRLSADLLLLESPWPCPTGREPRPTEAFPLLLAWQLEYNIIEIESNHLLKGNVRIAKRRQILGLAAGIGFSNYQEIWEAI